MRGAKYIAAAGILTLILGSQVGRAQQSTAPLTNQDVIAMAQSGLAESVILSAIRTNDTAFDVSASGLIALKKANVTVNVMQEMLNAANAKKIGTASRSPDQSNAQPPTQSYSPAPGGAPGGTAAYLSTGAAPAGMATGASNAAADAPSGQLAVSLVQVGQTINLPAEPTQIVQTKSKASSLPALAADQATNQAVQLGSQAAQQAVVNTAFGMEGSAVASSTNALTGVLLHRSKQKNVVYVWALAGSKSATTAGNNPCTIQVTYTGIRGVNTDAFEPVVVKLVPSSSNFRLVGATKAATKVAQSAQQNWPIYSSFMEHRVPADVHKTASGHAEITLAANLPPGEYAIALRPIDKAHKFSGEDIGKNQGEGLLFNYVWSFSKK